MSKIQHSRLAPTDIDCNLPVWTGLSMNEWVPQISITEDKASTRLKLQTLGSISAVNHEKSALSMLDGMSAVVYVAVDLTTVSIRDCLSKAHSRLQRRTKD